MEALYNAVFNCYVYGDERDSTLARWNLLQALWGTGKGKYTVFTTGIPGYSMVVGMQVLYTVMLPYLLIHYLRFQLYTVYCGLKKI
jgi:hypothetical protein